MLKKIFPLIIFFAFSVFWFSRELFGDRLFCFSDLTYYFYPYRYFMVESMKNGVFPLWNPYINLGFPFLATLQHGLLYPLSIIYFIFPFDQAFDLFLIIHYPLAAFFMYLLCRELKCSILASLGGGMTFGFSGYLISVLHMPTSLASVIWLPLIFIFYKRILDSQKNEIKNLLMASILLAIMFLGGEPTIILCTGYLLTGYLVYRKYNTPKGLVLGILTMGVVMLLFLLIDAVQILPFVELMVHSVRMGGMPYEEVMGFSLSPYRLIEMVIPYFSDVSYLPWVNNEWVKLSYLGVIPLMLSIFALANMSKRKAVLILLIILGVIILIIGKYFPLPVFYLFSKTVPGFKYIRYPVKMLFLLPFICSILTAYGIDCVGRERGKTEKIMTGLIIFVLVVTLLITPTIFYPQIYETLIKALISVGVIMRECEGLAERNLANIIITLLLSLLFLLWIKIGIRRRVSQFTIKCGILALIMIDLYLANVDANLSIYGKDYNVVPGNIKRLIQDKTEYRYAQSPQIFKKNYRMPYKDFIGYKKAFQSWLNRLVMDQNMRFKISAIDGYESIRIKDQDDLMNKVYQGESMKLLDLMNVKYLITDYPYKFGWNKLVNRTKDFREGYIYLFENVNCLPRSFYVPKAKIITDRGKALDYIASPKFEPLKEVVLEEQVDAPNGFWFTSERFYPGWKAFADGKEVKIYRANFMFRAVALPAKNSKITYVYDPLLFKIGLVISLTSIFGIFAYFTCSWTNKLKHPRA